MHFSIFESSFSHTNSDKYRNQILDEKIVYEMHKLIMLLQFRNTTNSTQIILN